jgi:ligand-binding sensor domain-containing protein
MWICTPGGLVNLNLESGEKKVYNHANSPIAFNPLQVLIDSQHIKWFYNISNIAFKNNDEWDSLHISDIVGHKDQGYEYVSRFVVSPDGRKYVLVRNSNSVYEIVEDTFNLLYKTSSADQVLSGLECDSKGNIWTSGMGFITGINDSNIQVFDSENSDLPDEYIREIYIDSEDRIWILPEELTDTSVLMYDSGKWTSWEESTFADYDIFLHSFTSDNAGNIWLSSSNGIFKYNGTIWEKVLDESVYFIHIDQQDRFWKIDDGKIFRRTEDGWTAIDLSSNTLDPSSSYCLQCSETGVYIGGESGISHFDGYAWTHFPTENPVYLLSKYSNSECLALIGNQLGLLSEKGIWNPLSHPNLPTNHFDYHSILLDSLGHFWISTEKGLFKYSGDNLTLIIDEPVYDIARDDYGIYWIATSSGLIKYQDEILERFTRENSNLSSNLISHLDIDSDNKLWLSSQFLIDEGCSHCVRYWYESHLLRYDDNTFIDIDSSCCLAAYFIDDYHDNFLIDKIVASKDNNLWIIENGLLHLNNDKIEYLTNENTGLANNAIVDLVVDDNGNVWILHSKALSVYNPEGLDLIYSNDNISEELFVFPNPSNEYFNIKFSSKLEGKIEITMIDMAGRTILHELRDVFPNTQEIQVTENGLKTGIYLLFVRTGNSLFKSKVLVLEKK